MGGCGKSQIASRFIYGDVLDEMTPKVEPQLQYDRSKVFFVDGTNAVTLEESYVSIAKCKGIGSTAQDALRWLSSVQEKSFTLIDNADSPELDLDAYIPRSTKAHVLVTTRLQDAGRRYASKGASIDVDPLPLEDAQELLAEMADLKNDQLEGASTLVQELSCHALAIAQAGACIAHLHLSLPQYIERFRRQRTGLMDGRSDGVTASDLHGYSRVIGNTWELTYQQLAPLAKEFFNLCAHLHHTGITQQLFRKAVYAAGSYKPSVSLSSDEEAALDSLRKAFMACQGNDDPFDEFAFHQCIAPILSLSLMRHDHTTRTYSIHPLILDSLKRNVPSHLPTSLLLMLAITHDREDGAFLYRLLPHVESVARRFSPLDVSSQTTPCHPDIAMAFSFVYSESGRWNSAESLQRASIASRTSALGSAHEETLQATSSLCLTLRKSGQLPAAEALGRSSLADWSREYGGDHPGTLGAAYEVAKTLTGLGQDHDAHKMLIGIVDQRKRMLGDDHPDTISATDTLADVLSSLGRVQEARVMRDDVLARRRRILGEDHPDTISAMNSLANVLSKLGEYKETEAMRLDVLAQRKRILGEDHPDTVTSMHNLADTFSFFGQHEAAEKMQQDVLARRKNLLGEDHPNTIFAMHNLANTWSKLERYEEAEKMRLDVLARGRRILGEDHPHTLLFIDNLAGTWFNLRRYEESEKMYSEVMERRRRTLGQEHPDVIFSMRKLARIRELREEFESESQPTVPKSKTRQWLRKLKDAF